MNASVPGGSNVDFIDSDRFEALIEKNEAKAELKRATRLITK